MMSSSEFVKILGVPLSTYSQWENESNNPPLGKAFDIAKKLNRRLEEIWYSEQYHIFFRKNQYKYKIISKKQETFP